MSASAKRAPYAGAHNADNLFLTGRERKLSPEDTIVSKTDIQGKITYANDVFLNISGYQEKELLGAPHSVVRHPHMPRCVFKLLWDTLARGEEIFAYVLNRCKNGDHYWVFAHVTPSYDLNNKLIGYHSSRRAPKQEAVNAVIPLYKQLLEIEKQGRKEGLEASMKAVIDLLATQKIPYDKFVFSL